MSFARPIAPRLDRGAEDDRGSMIRKVVAMVTGRLRFFNPLPLISPIDARYRRSIATNTL